MLCEKYRPKSLDEIVGQDQIVDRLKILAQQTDSKRPSMLFTGPAGVGKTSTAYAFASEIKYPVVEFNASDERGLPVIREKVKRIAFSAGNRIILLDEADQLTIDAQQALRRIMERCAPGIIFILTGNSEYSIIDPIKSRCVIFRFQKLADKDIAKVLVSILQKENIKMSETTPKALMKLIKICNGDLRRILNELETIINQNGTISEEGVDLLTKPDLARQSLETLLNSGDWEKALRNLEDALILNNDPAETTNMLYRAIGKIDVPFFTKLKLYDRLSQTEIALKSGCDPLIQLSGFLAYLWVLKHTEKKEMS